MAAPHVTTFYSFKGGVGRSLLLANVGAILARRGRRVLLWDLDVEAPGLHEIPALTPQPMPGDGFMEWVRDWQRRGMRKPKDRDLKELVGRVQCVPAQPNLSILPVCGERADFAALYEAIGWKTFLADKPKCGLELFRAVLEALSEHIRLDHILIDSRTGITDLGGLVAAVLPDATVLVGNYSAQNSAGLLHVFSALTAAAENKSPARGELGRLPLERLLVASPVPGGSESLRRERASAWAKTFPLGASEIRIEIPFDERLLFREELLAVTEPSSVAAQAYEAVADRVQGFREDWLEARESTERADLVHTPVKRGRQSDRPEDRKTKGDRFEDRVERLLRLLGYQVEGEQLVDGNRVDLIARKKVDFNEA